MCTQWPIDLCSFRRSEDMFCSVLGIWDFVILSEIGSLHLEAIRL